jgi:hypothetical protein
LLDGASIRVAEHDSHRCGFAGVPSPFPFTLSFALAGEGDRECEDAQNDQSRFHLAGNLFLLAFRVAEFCQHSDDNTRLLGFVQP